MTSWSEPMTTARRPASSAATPSMRSSASTARSRSPTGGPRTGVIIVAGPSVRLDSGAWQGAMFVTTGNPTVRKETKDGRRAHRSRHRHRLRRVRRGASRLGPPMRAAPCRCGGSIVPVSDDPEDIAAAVLAHNKTERHRTGSPYVEPPPIEVYVEPSPSSPSRTVLGPTPCHSCGSPVRVTLYPGGTMLAVHTSGSLACRPYGVAPSHSRAGVRTPDTTGR